MADKPVARLVGELGFNIDSKPLDGFFRKLGQAEKRMRDFGILAGQKYQVKVSLDTAGLRTQLERASNIRVRLKKIDVSPESLAAVKQQLGSTLGNTPIVLRNVRMSRESIVSQKSLLRSFMDATGVNLSVDVQTGAAMRKLRAWRTELQKNFKIYLEVDISRNKLMRNVKQSMADVMSKLGSIGIPTPMVKLKIDKVSLKSEIQAALKEISREVKLKVDLTSRTTGRSVATRAAAAERASTMGLGAAGGLVGSGLRGFLPGLGAAYAVSHLNTINQQLQAANNTATAVTGGQQQGQEALARLRADADYAGYDYRSAQMPFLRMIASGTTSGMKQEDVEKIFTNTAAYSRVMGLSQDDSTGVFRALEQMLSKGQVMSEELKSQLGDRMPGALSAMAKAVTGDETKTAELMDKMQKGQVKTNDVLLKFSEELMRRANNNGAFDAARNSTGSQQNRFNNAFTRSVEAFSEGGFDRAMGSFFKEAADTLNKLTPLFNKLGRAFEYLMLPMRAVIRLFADFGRVINDVLDNATPMEKIILAIGAALLYAMTPFGGIVLLVSGLALAIEDLFTYLEGGDSVIGDFFATFSPENKQLLDDVKASASQLWETMKSLGTTLGELLGILNQNSSTSEENLIGGLLKACNALLQTLDKILAAGNRIAKGDWAGVLGDAAFQMGSDAGEFWDRSTGGAGQGKKQTMFNPTSNLLGFTPDDYDAPDPMTSREAFNRRQPGYGTGQLLMTDKPSVGEVNITINGTDLAASEIQERVERAINNVYGNLKAGQTVTK